MLDIVKLSSTYGKPIKKIYHMADIHIRLGTRRHLEYRQVFNRVYDLIRMDPNDALVVVCGDILHSKTELSPECIDLTMDFFKNLGNICDVVIIMGNHDCNLANKTRLDSLSPLLKEVNTTHKIHYLLNTGAYEYNNLVFGVTSLWDKQLVKADSIESDKIKIALFHGMVYGSKTDVGYRLRDHEFKVSDFNGYRYVLLGDVHKHQYLGKKRRVCYPSSLIQQNYGESLLDHGLVKWDLIDGTSEFVRIPNDYGFVTMEVEKGVLKMHETDNTLPTNMRVKLQLYDTDKVQLARICNKLKKDYNCIEVTHTSTSNSGLLDIGANNETSELETKIVQLPYQISLIDAYAKKHYSLSDKEMEKLFELHRKFYEALSSESSVSKKWKINELTFSNMFCYGQKNVVDFTKLGGVCALIAGNYCGKSSLLDIVLFTLFDKCSRGIRSDVLNEKKKSFYCQLRLEIDGEEYIIRRYGKACKKNSSKIRIDVDFYREGEDEDSEEYLLLNGNDRNDTNKIICSYIGSYEDFIMTSFCLQNEINFIDYPQCKKKDFLMKLLKLDLFDGLLKMGRSELKSVDAVYKDLFQEMLKVDIGRMKRDLQDIVTKRTEEEEELEKAKEKQEGLVEQRDSCMRRIKKCKNFSDQTVASLEIEEDKLNNRLEKLEERSVTIREELEEAEKSLQSVGYSKEKEAELVERAERLEKDNQKKEKMLRVKIKKLMRTRKPVTKSCQGKSETFLKKKLKKLKNSVIELDDEEEVVKRFNQFKRYDRTLRDREDELERVVRMKKDMESKLEKLSKHKYDPNCKFCVNNIFVKDAIKTKKELDSVLEQEKELDEKVTYLTDKVKDLKDVVATHTKYWDNFEENKGINKQIDDVKAAIHNLDVDDKMGDLEDELEEVYDTVDEEYEEYMCKKKDYEKAESKVKDLTIKKFNCEAKITSVEKDLEKVEKRLEKAYKYKKVAEKNKKVEKELNQVEKSLKEVTKVVNNLNQSLTTTHTHVALLKNDMKNYNEKQKKLASLTERKKILTTYTNMVERNGLPYSLLTTIIPRIEITVNQILMPFNDFGVTIKLQKNGLVKVFKSFNGVERDAELCSTSEKFLIGTAIRVALTQMSNLSSCNFMVFDEGFSCLDGENSNNIECLFDYLRNKFDFVIIVSHLQQMRTMCDNTLNIDTSGKFSRIRY